MAACDDGGQLDQAQAAAQDIAEAVVWLVNDIVAEYLTERPYGEDPQVVLLAQGIQRALCFLRG